MNPRSPLTHTPTTSFVTLSAAAAMACLLLLPACPSGVDPEPPTPTPAPTGWSAEIHRDAYGVPSIVGDRLADLAFGDGYAQAEDRLAAMLLSYARARGREAERFGETCAPSCVNRDRSARLLRAEASAHTTYEALSEDEREIVDAFVAGVGHFIDSQPGGDVPQQALDYPPDPIDVLALSNYTMVGRQFTEAVQDRQSGGWVWDGGAGHGGESNGWSVREGGQVFVQADPHTPWDDFNWLWEHRWFTRDGAFSATGGTTTGLPGFVHAATPHHAWSYTRTGVDRGDCAVVQLSEDGAQYLRGGEWLDLQVVTEEILVAGQDPETLEIMMTVDGPIFEVADVDGSEGGYVAAMSMLGEARQFLQTLAMAEAGSLADFKAAIGQQQVSGFQMFYGDRDGELFYAWAGRIYDRNEDPAEPRAWNQCQPIWGEGQAFTGIRPFSGIPQSETPGVLGDVQFFQGSNAPNFILEGGDWGIRLSDYPDYVHTATEIVALPARPQRVTDLLGAGGHTSPGMLELSMDTQVLAAEWALPALELAIDGFVADGGVLTEQESAALQLLADWDLVCDLESAAYTLWRELATTVATTGYYLSRIRNTYPELPGDPSVIPAPVLETFVGFFQGAVATVPRDPDGAIRPWGEINVIDRETGDVPLGAGGSDTQTMWQGSSRIDARDADDVSHVTGGSNFMMSTRYDLDSGDVEVWSISAKGQSEDPQSAHYDDQTHLYVQRGYKASTVSMDVATAEENVESRITVGVP